MAFLVFKGTTPKYCIVFIALSYLLSRYVFQNFLLEQGLTVYSSTFYLAAFLCLPLGFYDLVQSRKVGKPMDSLYYVPLYVLPLILAVLGYGAQNYNPSYLDKVQQKINDVTKVDEYVPPP